jgi:hypothetical protein
MAGECITNSARTRPDFLIDTLLAFWQHAATMTASEDQFSLARSASRKGRCIQKEMQFTYNEDAH